MFAKLSDTIARSFCGTRNHFRRTFLHMPLWDQATVFRLSEPAHNALYRHGFRSGVGKCLVYGGVYPASQLAGGFHAKTPVRCYWYSAAMIAIVLALLRFVPLPLWTAVPVYMISSILLWLLAPVETSHKPLDELEQRVYRHRARLIWCVESLVMIGLFFLQLEQAGNCILLSMAALSVMLAAENSSCITHISHSHK